MTTDILKTQIEIDVNREVQSFVLSNNIDLLLGNKRLLMSLRRLGYYLEDEEILIPYKEETKTNTLIEIQDLLTKFNITRELSTEVKNDVKSFVNEQEQFSEFAQMARNIRENKFGENPSLVEDFRIFQQVLKEKLVRNLYPLQLLSAFHMAFAQNSSNFSVPGAGKTAIVYGAYAYLKNLPSDNPKHIDKLLIIGPLSSFAPWEKEYVASFGKGTSVKRLSGGEIKKQQKEEHLYSGNPAEITLIFHGGVDGLKNAIVDFLKRNKTMVVIDEAHRIKNPDGVWGKSIIEIAKEAKSRIILTGTPVPNGYEDLYNLFQFLYPYKYKDILGFHFDNLVDMTKNSSLGSERVKSFIQNIKPYFIRIKKADLKLPPIQEHVIEIEMSQNQREIYDFIETKYIRFFTQNNSATLKDVLNKARLIRLRQAATNPGLLQKTIRETLLLEDYESKISRNLAIPDEFQDDSEILSKIDTYTKLETPVKFVSIKSIVDNIVQNKGKVIIWSIFIQNAKELQRYLSNNYIRAELLIGEVEQLDREQIIDKFNNPDNFDFQVVIANPFSVAESISLHKGCHNAIYLERDYNCANFLQSKDRIHRYGLSENQETNYYYLLSKDSIDEVIEERLKIKVKRMENIIDEEIPLFTRINDNDETDLIRALIENYAKRT